MSAFWCAFTGRAFAASSCESLSAVSLPHATITTATIVPAGSFAPPTAIPTTNPNALNAYKSLPDFCRVAATLAPSSDSDIKIEVWLPTSGWNRKFQAVGNGGWAGVISYSALADAVNAGYAAASTDTGHVGGSGSFALGHPEKLVDFSWRSEHEMTVKAKAIIKAFYGSEPRRSYWNGCSTGGRQGLKAAQMFPDDFDGIIAGAPANRTPLALWIASAVLKDKASYIPASKYPAIHRAVVEACDAHDGVKDGLIEDPSKCAFDPQTILCKDGDTPACLTTPQVTAARQYYTPGTNPRTGEELFPAFARGSELGWGVMGSGPDPYGNLLDQYRYVVFQDPKWDWRTFNFDSDYAKSLAPQYVIMNATDPNLKRFFAHNGKLLIYHGWNDPNVSPFNTVKYYKGVVERLGTSRTANNIRLFMAPGMGHCAGGEGPNTFDKIGTLDQWVEQDQAPDRIVASHARDGKVDRTRPLCPFPQVAKYKGTGSIDDADSFACAAR
jgi:feruloyl esterase